MERGNIMKCNNLTENDKKILGMLKAFFTVNYMGLAYHNGGDGCPTCGAGATPYMDLEDIYRTIDLFIEKNGNV